METVHHPRHYNAHPSGIEVIDICERMGFNLGNAFKYMARADHKGRVAEDFRKAAWYVQRSLDVEGIDIPLKPLLDVKFVELKEKWMAAEQDKIRHALYTKLFLIISGYTSKVARGVFVSLDEPGCVLYNELISVLKGLADELRNEHTT